MAKDNLGKININLKQADASDVLFQILGSSRSSNRALRIVRELDSFMDGDDFIVKVYEWSKRILSDEGYL